MLTYAAIAPLSLDADGPSRVRRLRRLRRRARAGRRAASSASCRPATRRCPELRAQATAAARTIRELQATPTSPPAASTGYPAQELGAPPDAPFAASDGGSALGEPTTSPATDEAEPEASAVGGLATPILAFASNRFVLPGLAIIALLSALGTVEITKRPRRAQPVAAPTSEAGAG